MKGLASVKLLKEEFGAGGKASLISKINSLSNFFGMPLNDAQEIMLNATSRYADWEMASILGTTPYYIRKIRLALGIAKTKSNINLTHRTFWPLTAHIQRNAINVSAPHTPRKHGYPAQTMPFSFNISGEINVSVLKDKIKKLKGMGNIDSFSIFIKENISEEQVVTQSFNGEFTHAKLSAAIDAISAMVLTNISEITISATVNIPYKENPLEKEKTLLRNELFTPPHREKKRDGNVNKRNRVRIAQD